MTDNNTHENEFRETPSRMARYHTEAAAPPKKERKRKAVQVTEVEPTEPVAPQPKNKQRHKKNGAKHRMADRRQHLFPTIRSGLRYSMDRLDAASWVGGQLFIHKRV